MKHLLFYIISLLTLIVLSPAVGLSVDDAANEKNSFGTISAQTTEQKDATFAGTSSTTASLAISPTAASPAPQKQKQEKKQEAPSSIKIEDAFIKEKVIHLNKLFHFVIKVSWEGNLGDFKIYSPKDPAVLGAEIKNLQVTNTTFPDIKKSTVEYLYTLKPSEVGNGSVSPVEINYSYKGSEENLLLTTRIIPFTIEPALKDWSKTLALVFAGIGGIGAVILLTLIGKGQLQRKNTTEAAESKTPYDDLLTSSKELGEHIEDSDVTKLYDELLQIVIKFLSIYSNKPLKKFTNKELYDFLETMDFEQEVKDKILSMYYQCEQVLYGGYSPQSFDRKALIRDIINLIEDKNVEYKNQVTEEMA